MADTDDGCRQAGPAENDAQTAAPVYLDPVIEAFKAGVDRTLLRENLKLTPNERFLKFQQFAEFARELKEAGRKARMAPGDDEA